MRLITRIIIIGILLSIAQPAFSQGQPATKSAPNQILEDCADQYPEYAFDLYKPYPGQYHLNFRIALEKAKKNYHGYIECIFEKSTDQMLDSMGASTAQWTSPDHACLDVKALTDVQEMSSPANLLDPIIFVYNEYVDYLNILFDRVSNLPSQQGDETNINFNKLANQQVALGGLIQNEIQNAIVALDTGFIALKEMRQAYTIHVQFMCMIKNLKLYSQALSNLRSIIYALPPVIENASAHK